MKAFLKGSILLLLISIMAFAAGKPELNKLSTHVKSVIAFIAQKFKPSLVSKHTTQLDNFTAHFVDAALERTQHHVRYDGRYMVIAYPNGDVPEEIGVCSDEVIRVYRKLGVDLQKDLHEDMVRNFTIYPKKWGLKRPDTNIDHRRVPNLQTLFTRKGQVLTTSQTDAHIYKAGDLVTWMLPGNLPHIGMVTDQRSEDSIRPLIVHNIGSGPKLEDMLFNYPITGHYRYYGTKKVSKKQKIIANSLKTDKTT
jgi:uncharacterized protein YijF (DUF1287 family)